jgi:uncharacterized protein (TIGR03435 family)
MRLSRPSARLAVLFLSLLAVFVFRTPVQLDLFGQTIQPATSPKEDRPSFEVASIKPNRSETQQPSLGLPPGGFTATDVSVKLLIQWAYDDNKDHLLLRGGQISGGPSWINTERFDINAKVDAPHIEKMKTMAFNDWTDQVRLMVQSLLVDRFHLKVTYETREAPEYALVVGKGGAKLVKSTAIPISPLGPGTASDSLRQNRP